MDIDIHEREDKEEMPWNGEETNKLTWRRLWVEMDVKNLGHSMKERLRAESR